MFKRRLMTALKILAAACLGALHFGFVYEQSGRSKDRKRIPQIGHFSDIGERTLNIFCLQTGSPAVIFESGGSDPGLSWEQTQTIDGNFFIEPGTKTRAGQTAGPLLTEGVSESS